LSACSFNTSRPASNANSRKLLGSIAQNNRIPALLVVADAFFTSSRAKVAALAARHAVPAMYYFRDFAMAGGLMSYGTDLAERYRLIGVYAGRILKGEKPTTVQTEILEARMVNGEAIDIATLCTLASTTVRLSQRLGLERHARTVTPSLNQYLASRTNGDA
jgi:hypothetical protein